MEPRQGIQRQQQKHQTRRLFAFAELSPNVIYPVATTADNNDDYDVGGGGGGI